MNLTPCARVQLREVPEFFLCNEVAKCVTVFLLYHLGLIGLLPTAFFDPVRRTNETAPLDPKLRFVPAHPVSPV